jgi:hypothetical protein
MQIFCKTRTLSKKKRRSRRLRLISYYYSWRQIYHLEVKADGSDDFEGLKRLIHEKKGVPVEWQSLYYAQKELADGQTLASCGIKRESTLHLHMHMIRPCPCGCGEATLE